MRKLVAVQNREHSMIEATVEKNGPQPINLLQSIQQ